MTKVDYDTKVRRNKYWTFLGNVQKEFTDLTWNTEYGTQADFENFLTQHYGIAPIMDDGRYTDSFKIVNDKKFLLTKIKYDI
jgi:hypothetical protein